jgi:hypothetical protein
MIGKESSETKTKITIQKYLKKLLRAKVSSAHAFLASLAQWLES